MTLGGIRPAVDEDVPAILALYGRVYPGGSGRTLERRGAYLQRILMENPWRSDDLPSLIYENGAGQIVGFLGVMPRPMLMRGRLIRMAVSHHLMVDPASRTTLAGVSLLKAFLAGKQDLSICEPEAQAIRTMWEALGGTTALLQTLHWTWPIRPMEYLAWVLRKQRKLAPVASAVRPACRALDAVVTMMRHRSHPPAGNNRHRELAPAALLECIEESARRCSLRPVYDLPTLTWLLDILAGKKRWGELRVEMVCNASDRVVGYYLYYAKPGGVSEILQVGTRTGSMRELLDHLAHDARAGGSLALAGRLDPRYAPDISDRLSYFKYGGNWFLIHTRDPEVERALYRGDAFLTRLEGEWWIPFDTGSDRNQNEE